MEFRCPACDTSYRVPVRIGQQVRCARCDHVWRVAETDFVAANEAPAHGDMPDEFSQAHEDDRREHQHQDAGLRQVHDSLSTLFERSEDWPGERRGLEAGQEHTGSDAARDDWPGSGWQQPASEPADETQADAHAAAASAASMHEADAYDEPQHRGPDDHATATQTDFAGEPATAGTTEEDSPQKQIADSWFGSSLGNTADDAEDAGAQEHEGSFERIMEGIEEVIAENSQSEEQHSEFAESAELSALIGAGQTPEQRTGADTGDEDAGSAGATVVQFTAPGADQRLSEPGGRQNDWTGEAWNSVAETGEPMSKLLNQLASHRSGDAPEDAHDHGRVEARYETDISEDDAAEDATAAAGALDPAQAHFAARQAGTDKTSAARAQSHDPYMRGSEDSGESYYHADPEAAQRDSLAFSTDREEFDKDENSAEEWDGTADIADGPYTADMPEGTAPDDAASLAARSNTPDDDMLLAEYDFGDAASEQAVPPDIAARRSPGLLVVGAAWALFLAVLAGAGWSAISFRERVVEALPAAAPVYAAIGFPVSQIPLALEDVSYALKGQPPNVLILKGRVTHTGGSLVEMPNLKITVRDGADEPILEETRFLGQAALLPGETLEFEVDLDVPAERLRTVELKF